MTANETGRAQNCKRAHASNQCQTLERSSLPCVYDRAVTNHLRVAWTRYVAQRASNDSRYLTEAGSPTHTGQRLFIGRPPIRNIAVQFIGLKKFADTVILEAG